MIGKNSSVRREFELRKFSKEIIKFIRREILRNTLLHLGKSFEKTED
jgi:hypothetical protein